MSVERYLTFYNTTWAELVKLQDHYPLQEYQERSVLTTWRMSYEQVRTVDRQAAALLDQWAFLYAGDVWYELAASSLSIVELNGTAEGVATIATDELNFRHSLGVLSHYSLVVADVEGTGFSIHPVVHAWCLHNIACIEVREQLCGRAVRLIVEMIPSSDSDSQQSVARRLAPHARVAAARHLEGTEEEKLRETLYSIASFLSDWEGSQEVEGKMQEAEEMYLRALRGYEEAWGPKHTSTLDTLNNLGLLYSDQGKMQEAEEMYLRALRGKEEAWGPKHTSTLDTVYNVGLFYSDQGRMQEAEEMFVRAVDGYQNAEGDHEADIEYLQEQLETLRVGRQAPSQHLQSESRNLRADSSSDVVDQNDRTARMRDFVLRVLMQP
ncbi:hypothetical protein LTR17_027458 [Elasticomyces elasticus]|nr:hypothetical protein LTR17_027458 [Elasticomyces elasticus]